MMTLRTHPTLYSYTILCVITMDDDSGVSTTVTGLDSGVSTAVGDDGSVGTIVRGLQ